MLHRGIVPNSSDLKEHHLPFCVLSGVAQLCSYMFKNGVLATKLWLLQAVMS